MMHRYDYGLDILGSLSPGELKMDSSLSSPSPAASAPAGDSDQQLLNKIDVDLAEARRLRAEPSPAPAPAPAPTGEVNTSFRMSNAAQGGGLSLDSSGGPGAAQGGGLSLTEQPRGGGGGSLSPGELRMDPSLSSPGYAAPSTQPSYAAPSPSYQAPQQPSYQPQPAPAPSYQAQPSYQPQPQQYPQQQPQQQQQPAASGGGMASGMPWLSAAGTGISAISEQLQQMEDKRKAEEQAGREKKEAEARQRAAEAEAKRAADLAKIKPSPQAAKRLAAAQKNLAATQALLNKFKKPAAVVQTQPASAFAGRGAKIALGAAVVGALGFGVYKWRSR